MKTFTKITLAAILLSPLLWRGLGGEAFAQNTFRYAVCPDIGPLPRWNIGFSSTGSALSPENNFPSIACQVPSDSGYISFTTAIRDRIVIPGMPSDSLPWECFSATSLDKYGNLKWVKTYQEVSGINRKVAFAATLTTDSGFVMAGYKYNPGDPYYNGKNTFIQKIDKNGTLLWAKLYVNINGSNDNSIVKAGQVPDGGCIVLGQTQDDQKPISYLLRLDKNGNKTWCYVYDANKDGGSGTFSSMDLTTDGGFILAGGTNASGFNQDATYGSKALMMKLAADGKTIEWTKRYGEVFKGTLPYTNEEITNDVFYDVKQTSDSGYIAVGQTHRVYDSRGWVVKTDAQGVIEWQKTFSNKSYNTVKALSDGYILSDGNGRMTKISKTGEVLWSKIHDQSFSDFSLTVDKGFVMSMGKYITKTNSSGEFENGCVYNDALYFSVDERVDSSYTITSKSASLSPSNVPMQEITITGRCHCPVICGVSNKAIAPSYIYASGVCVNKETSLNLRPEGSGYSLFSHYKVNFGDPASGTANEISGSNVNESNLAVSHTYSDTGTYTITMVVYNGDYSESDTVALDIKVAPTLQLSLLTPEVRVCRLDTVSIAVRVRTLNKDGDYINCLWTPDNSTTPGMISQSRIGNDSVVTFEATVIADTSQDYYTLFVYRQGFCSVQDTIRVITGDNEAFITGDTKICQGGTASLRASGGDSYVWSTGATTQALTVSPLFNKTYWVEATSADGCRDTAYVYVQVVSEIKVEAVADRKAVCMGDTVTLYASGAQNYTWNNGSSGDTIEVVPANGQNTYVVTGTNGSCTDMATVIISADSIPNGSISGPSSVCYLGTYTVTASGGDSYEWAYSSDKYNPVQTFYMQSNNYNNSVTITKGGCSITKDYSIVSWPPRLPAIGGIDANECRVCPGTTVTLRKYFYPFPSNFTDTYPDDNIENQGLMYQWSTGQTGSGTNDSIKVTVTSDTIITLTTTNSYGCSVTNSVSIEATPHFYIRAEAASAASCSNTPTTFFLSGEPLDGEYSWSVNRSGTPVLSSNDTLVASFAGDTMLYITATANGCTRTDSVFVYAKSNLPEARIHGDSLVCRGFEGTYTAFGEIAVTGFDWLAAGNADTLSSFSLPIVNDTTIRAVVNFTGGCKDTAEYKVNVINIPQALISGDTLVCPGAIVSLKASGGYTYQWGTGSTLANINITAMADTLLQLYAFAGNCSDTAVITIRTNQSISATLFSDEDTICSGTALTLIAGGGDNYTWNTGEKSQMIGILPALTTTYAVIVTTNDNCIDAESITINVLASPTLSVSGPSSICSGESAVLNASGSSPNFLWSTGASTPSISVMPGNDSIFYVASSGEGCTDSVGHTITVVPSTSISAGAGQTVLSGTEVTLEATGGNNYSWSTLEDGLLCDNCNSLVIQPAKTTTYYVTETNSPCSEDSVTIYVLNCSELGIPNAFSPNGDQVNDVLFLQNDCIKNLALKIYDRWGEEIVNYKLQIANGESSIQVWDGTYKGQMMDPAVFVYYVSVTVLSGEVLTQKGNVTLIR